jgi:hypothetical protein
VLEIGYCQQLLPAVRRKDCTVAAVRIADSPAAYAAFPLQIADIGFQAR